MPKMPAEYHRKIRADRSAGIECPRCQCGRQLRGELSKSRGICSFCWKATTQGKLDTLAAVNKCRKKDKPATIQSNIY